MYKYNPYADTHMPSEQVANFMDAIRSMRTAIDEGGEPDGKRACMDRRFRIQKHQAGGVDEFAAYTIYDVAGVDFKVYRDSCKGVSIEVPQFDLAYDDCDMRFKKYGTKHGCRTLLVVGSLLIERDPNVTPREVFEDVFGWKPVE